MKFNIIFLIIYFFSINVFSQESLESILSEIDDSESSSAVTSTFKSTRIINGHSVELASPKSLEFRIAHRFGPINNGFYDIFGLDAATIKMSFEYGINDKMMAGFGRSSYQKSYDIFCYLNNLLKVIYIFFVFCFLKFRNTQDSPEYVSIIIFFYS